MATDNQTINKVWSEDTNNKASFTEDEVGTGIVYQGPIVSSQLNGLGNLTTKALKYLQRTGGYWNAAISYTAGDFVNILQYQKSGTLTLTTYRCVKDNINQPPYTGTKQGTGDTPLFLYGGSVNSTYWSKVSYTGEGQDSEYVTRFTNQNITSTKWLSPETNLTNKININGADTTFTRNSTDTNATLHFSQKGADPLNSERGALLVDDGVSLQAYPGRANADKVKGLWDVNLGNSGASNEINDINNMFFGVYDVRTTKAAGNGSYAGIHIQHNYDAGGYFTNPNSYNYSVEVLGQKPYSLGDTGRNIATFTDLSKVYSQIPSAPRQQFSNIGSNQPKWSTYKSAFADLKPNYTASYMVNTSTGHLDLNWFTGTPYNLYTLLNSAGMLTDIDIGDISNPKTNPLVRIQLNTTDGFGTWFPDVLIFFSRWVSKTEFTVSNIMGMDKETVNQGSSMVMTGSVIVPLFNYYGRERSWEPTKFIWCQGGGLSFSNWIKNILSGLVIYV